MSTRASRSKKPAAKSKSASQSQSNGPGATSNAPKLGPKDENPPHILILPKDSSPAGRVITIEGHSSSRHRYFVDPAKGIYEFTAVSHPRHACRSWLLAPPPEDAPQNDPLAAAPEDRDGYVMSSSTMLVATPVDPLFVLLGIPAVLHSSDTASRFEFETFDNRMWSLRSAAPQLGRVLAGNPDSHLERSFRSRIKDVCDEQSLGGDLQYCLAVSKLARYLLDRSQTMASVGLPASMEEQFVRQALEVPELSVRREDSGVSVVSEEKSDKVDDGSKREDAFTPADNDLKRERAIHLLRVRVALDYMLANYIPRALRDPLRESFKTQCDFSILDDQLKEIARLKAEALALRSISDNISRKRGTLDDDDEAVERQEAKKRKKEEEEQKKKSMSQGVKKLLKADTSGMKKLSSFFTKPAVKK